MCKGLLLSVIIVALFFKLQFLGDCWTIKSIIFFSTFFVKSGLNGRIQIQFNTDLLTRKAKMKWWLMLMAIKKGKRQFAKEGRGELRYWQFLITYFKSNLFSVVIFILCVSVASCSAYRRFHLSRRCHSLGSTASRKLVGLSIIIFLYNLYLSYLVAYFCSFLFRLYLRSLH